MIVLLLYSLQYSDSSAVWKKGSLLKKNLHQALLRQVKDQQLVLVVQGPRPENVLFLVHEVLGFSSQVALYMYLLSAFIGA